MLSSSKEKQIRISVCVPVYGVEKYIERCARSLFEQTLQDDIEFIFLNDCTPDNSILILQKVLNEYPDRRKQTRIIDNSKNQGLGSARNSLVFFSTGKYIFFVDADDYIATNTLEKLWNIAENNSSDFVAGEVLMLCKDREIRYNLPSDEDKNNYLPGMLTLQQLPRIWGNLIRRSLYMENHITVPDGINMGEDLIVTPRLLYYAERIDFCHEILYYYDRSNMISITSSVSLQKVQQIVRVYQFLKDFFTNIPDASIFEKICQHMYQTGCLDLIQYAASDISCLKYLKKNFDHSVFYAANQPLPVKIANAFFHLGLLRFIVWGTHIFKWLKSL